MRKGQGLSRARGENHRLVIDGNDGIERALLGELRNLLRALVCIAKIEGRSTAGHSFEHLTALRADHKFRVEPRRGGHKIRGAVRRRGHEQEEAFQDGRRLFDRASLNSRIYGDLVPGVCSRLAAAARRGYFEG